MIIDPKDTLFGFPILSIRKLLNSLREYRAISIKGIYSDLHISKKRAEKLASDLVDKGYFKCEIDGHGLKWYTVQSKGRRLAKAYATKPLHRSTADKKLQEFLQRVKEVNNNNYYLYRVTKVILFGSYLTDKERIGDVDIAIELEHKIIDPVLRKNADIGRYHLAIKNGRQLNSMLDDIFWPYNEVVLFLKSRARSIDLTDTSDPVLEETKTKVLLDLKRGINKL
ncbi:MAG: nucleotidyltransferase domain-containing protein [Ignavibacteria bacterium]|nr:nucleotidyltransferase domain-containing protein [Ignavibacteria bacterium]MCU7526541.1 nucleotidyltransferase domain-containing protein [Ignavibacteria bacterium]